jgi:hypothetical protein
MHHISLRANTVYEPLIEIEVSGFKGTERPDFDD